MVKRLTNYLIIDWGFTRFKLWFLDENRKIIKDSFLIIKDINTKPEFYTKKELDNIFEIILKFQLGVTQLQTAQNDTSKAIPRNPERSDTFQTISKLISITSPCHLERSGAPAFELETSQTMESS